jgi:hypothetical protein
VNYNPMIGREASVSCVSQTLTETPRTATMRSTPRAWTPSGGSPRWAASASTDL